MVNQRVTTVGAHFILLGFMSLSSFAFSSGKQVILVLPPNHELQVIHLKDDAASGDPSGNDGRLNAWLAADSGGSAGQTTAGHSTQEQVYDVGNSGGSSAKYNRRPAWSRPVGSDSVEASNDIFDGGSSFGGRPEKSNTRNPVQESNGFVPRGKWPGKLRGEEERYNPNEGNRGTELSGPQSWSTLVRYPQQKPIATSSSARGPNRGPFYGRTFSWSGDTFNNVDLNKGISNIKPSNNGWENQNNNNFRPGKNGWSNTGNNNINFEEQGWKVQENNVLQTNNGWKSDSGNKGWKSEIGKNPNSGWNGISLKSVDNGWNNPGINSVKSYKNGLNGGKYLQSDVTNTWSEQGDKSVNPSANRWKDENRGSFKSFNSGWDNPGTISVHSSHNGWKVSNNLQSENNKWLSQDESSSIDTADNGWKSQASGRFNPLNNGWKSQESNSLQSASDGWNTRNNQQLENSRWKNQGTDTGGKLNNNFQADNIGYEHQGGSSFSSGNSGWRNSDLMQGNNGWKDQGITSIRSENSGWSDSNLMKANNGWKDQGVTSIRSENSGWSDSNLMQGNNGWKDQGVTSIRSENSEWSDSNLMQGNNGWKDQPSISSDNSGWKSNLMQGYRGWKNPGNSVNFEGSSQSVIDLQSNTNGWDNRDTSNKQHGWENQTSSYLPTKSTITEFKYKENSSLQSTSDGWVPNQIQPSKGKWIANDQGASRPSVQGSGFLRNNDLEKYKQSRNQDNNLNGKYSTFRTQDETQGNGWVPMGGNYLQEEDKYRAGVEGSKTPSDENVFQDTGYEGRNLGDDRPLSNTVWQSIEGNKLTKGGYRPPLRDSNPEGQTFETGGSFKEGQSGQTGWTAIKGSDSSLRDDKQGCNEEYGSKCHIVKVIHVVSNVPQEPTYEKAPEEDRGWSPMRRPNEVNDNEWKSSWKSPGDSPPTSYGGSDFAVKEVNSGSSGVTTEREHHGQKESLRGSGSSSETGTVGGGDGRHAQSEDADIYIGVNSYGLKVHHGNSKFYHKGNKGNVGGERHAGNVNSYSSVTFGESKRPFEVDGDAKERKYFKRKVSSSKTSSKRIFRGAESNLRAAVTIRSTNPKK